MQLGDRMKEYENVESKRRFASCVPLIARLDGRSFSKFTRGLCKPYDFRLSKLMCDTTKHVMKETGAFMGYTQSDEITLVFYSKDADVQTPRFFDGRVQKFTSVLAGITTAYFVRQVDAAIPEKAGTLPVFDCRVWSVPDVREAANSVLWRVHDAERNSVAMAAQTVFHHKKLHNVDKTGMLQMLSESGNPWDVHPSFFKWGTLIRRETIIRRFCQEELDALPPRHEARKNPHLKFQRTLLQCVSLDERPTFQQLLGILAS